ncbi:hypothetical protein Nepgr_022802 [Nepenthes gracilis]|uniref:Uncharacterized protein n=1 Tax=Nepenthes gracilis TaxID=150966 RepID=A0AAD3T051_NEPGR|nr:hypothetical protein Nepgr_022802 [Nepenthes gracilis]
MMLLLVKRWLQLPIFGFGSFDVAVDAALYIAEAGMAVQVFWNLAAVLLRGHVNGGPALLLMVPPVVCGQCHLLILMLILRFLMVLGSGCGVAASTFAVGNLGVLRVAEVAVVFVSCSGLHCVAVEVAACLAWNDPDAEGCWIGVLVLYEVVNATFDVEPYADADVVRLAWRWKAPDFLSPACYNGFCVWLLAAPGGCLLN